MRFPSPSTLACATFAIIGMGLLVSAADPSSSPDSATTSLSDEDREILLLQAPAPEPVARPQEKRVTARRGGRTIQGEKIEITNVEPEPEGSPEPQASTSPVYTPSTAGETGIL